MTEEVEKICNEKDVGLNAFQESIVFKSNAGKSNDLILHTRGREWQRYVVQNEIFGWSAILAMGNAVAAHLAEHS